MTVTFLAWIAVALRVALTGVRFVHPRRGPAVVPVLASGPRPAADSRRPGDEGWRPRVSSGCGR
jgi:hypothetical protein